MNSFVVLFYREGQKHNFYILLLFDNEAMKSMVLCNRNKFSQEILNSQLKLDLEPKLSDLQNFEIYYTSWSIPHKTLQIVVVSKTLPVASLKPSLSLSKAK